MARLFALLVGLVALASTPALAATYNLTLAGASPGGLWSLLGVGVDAAVRAEFPGSTITYQTSGGGIANVALLLQRKAELGIVHNAELKLATEGRKPFRAPVTQLRAIAYLYNWAPMQLVLTKAFADEYGIRTLEDIAAKKPPLRMVLNKRGNIGASVGEQIFEAIGVSLADIEAWGGQVVYAASAEQADLMKDRRIDLINNTLFVGHKSLLEVGQAIEVTLLPLPEHVIEEVGRKAGIDPFVIKAGSYRWQEADVPTVSLGAVLVAHADMGEQTAYDLTRALVEQIDRLRQVHASMKALTPKLMAGQRVVPYHPGALRYYREAGLSE